MGIEAGLRPSSKEEFFNKIARELKTFNNGFGLERGFGVASIEVIWASTKKEGLLNATSYFLLRLLAVLDQEVMKVELDLEPHSVKRERISF